MIGRRLILPWVSVLLSAAALVSCAPTEDRDTVITTYPEPIPDDVPLPFLPGIVCSDSTDFNAAFSPDGKAFYFSRKIGHVSHIYISHFDGTRWQLPELAPFSTAEYADADPAFGPDGRFYFISNRPVTPVDKITDYDIWYLDPPGNWQEPHNLSVVNTDSAEYYVSFSKSGNLYFASSRAGGFGEEDIYVSKLTHGNYSLPENLGRNVNSGLSEYDPFISSGEDILVFTASNRMDGFGNADLYVSGSNAMHEWVPAVNLGDGINTSSREYCPYITPDGKYLFFTSQGDVKWANVSLLKRKRNP